MAEITLEQFCSLVGAAVQQAQQSIENYACHSYWQYFEPAASTDAGDNAEGGEVFTPKFRRIRLPGPVEREVRVPLLSLVNHAAMSLEQVKVRVKVQAKSTPVDGLKVEIAPLGPQDAVQETNTTEAPENTIELTFKKAMPTEGVSRILQEAVKFL